MRWITHVITVTVTTEISGNTITASDYSYFPFRIVYQTYISLVDTNLTKPPQLCDVCDYAQQNNLWLYRVSYNLKNIPINWVCAEC